MVKTSGGWQSRAWTVCLQGHQGSGVLLKKKNYLFILFGCAKSNRGRWDPQLRTWGPFVTAFWVFSFSMWDLIPCPGIKARPPALGGQSPRLWITREVPGALLPRHPGHGPLVLMLTGWQLCCAELSRSVMSKSWTVACQASLPTGFS